MSDRAYRIAGDLAAGIEHPAVNGAYGWRSAAGVELHIVFRAGVAQQGLDIVALGRALAIQVYGRWEEGMVELTAYVRNWAVGRPAGCRTMIPELAWVSLRLPAEELARHALTPACGSSYTRGEAS